MKTWNDHDLPQRIFTKFSQYYRQAPIDSADKLQELIQATTLRLDNYRDSFFGPDLRVAGEVASRYTELLAEYTGLSHYQRSLLTAGIKYFATEADIIPDSTPIVGLDDDIFVLNYVLRSLGKESRYISV